MFFDDTGIFQPRNTHTIISIFKKMNLASSIMIKHPLHLSPNSPQDISVRQTGCCYLSLVTEVVLET